MIDVSEEVRKDIQVDMLNNFNEADTQLIDGNILENLYPI